MIWQYLNDISTDYMFGGSRYEPYNTDCSGIVYDDVVTTLEELEREV